MQTERQQDSRLCNLHRLSQVDGSAHEFGNSPGHESMDKARAAFTRKETAMLLTLGCTGMASVIDTLLDRHDVLVCDQGIQSSH